jgi:hypothetical protein
VQTSKLLVADGFVQDCRVQVQRISILRAFADHRGSETGSISAAPVLAYYQPAEQCDSSQIGLGAALIQNAQPIAYSSRALAETEFRYAQIEKEMLAVVVAVEKFNDYTFG